MEQPPAEPDITLNPSMNPNMADRIDDLRVTYGLPPVASLLNETSSRETSDQEAPEKRGQEQNGTFVREITEVRYRQNIFFGEGNVPIEIGSVKYAVIICIILAVLIVLIVCLRDFFDKYCNPILIQRISHVSRDTTAMLIIVALVLWVRFQRVFIFGIPVSTICLCVSVFALCWFIWCIYVVIYAQAHSVNWEEKEIQGGQKGNF